MSLENTPPTTDKLSFEEDCDSGAETSVGVVLRLLSRVAWVVVLRASPMGRPRGRRCCNTPPCLVLLWGVGINASVLSLACVMFPGDGVSDGTVAEISSNNVLNACWKSGFCGSYSNADINASRAS